MRSVVVLPAPFGPRKPVTWPGSTLKLRSLTAATAPKFFERLRMSMTAPAGMSPVKHETRRTRPMVGSAGSDQSIGSAPWATSSSFARLNGFEPKNPRAADSGLGCADSITGVCPEQRHQRPGVVAPEDRTRAVSDVRPGRGWPVR